MTAQLLKLQTAPDLVDQVYRALLDAISDGSLAPGLRITQEDLAERFAVSRQPVLQALRILKKDGLVLDAPGRGPVLQAAPQRESIWDEHQAIADAIAAGEIEQSVALIERHGQQARENLLGLLPDVLADLTKANP